MSVELREGSTFTIPELFEWRGKAPKNEKEIKDFFSHLEYYAEYKVLENYTFYINKVYIKNYIKELKPLDYFVIDYILWIGKGLVTGTEMARFCVEDMERTDLNINTLAVKFNDSLNRCFGKLENKGEINEGGLLGYRKKAYAIKNENNGFNPYQKADRNNHNAIVSECFFKEDIHYD